MSTRNCPTRCLLVACALLVLAYGCGKSSTNAKGSTDPHQLTVYVPCGMELPFSAAKDAFEKAYPGNTVNVVLDNGNILVHRILDRGETPDIIVSPGTLEMQMLENGGAVPPGGGRPFGRFELMLFVPRENPGDVHVIADLTKPSVEVLAIADPDKNSVGAYTKQALQALGLWDKLKPKMTFADHPITAYEHVAREKAQASFAYRTCPLKTAPEKLAYSRIRIMEPVPPETYGPAFACAGILTKAAHKELAKKFVAMLLSPEGQKMLNAHDIPSLSSLSLSVPCGLSTAFDTIAETFRESHPGVLVDVVADQPGAAPGESTPDARILIGKANVEQLTQAGAIAAQGAHAIGSLQLALCVPRAQASAVTQLSDVTKASVKRIVLPDEKDPAGQCAKKALEQQGVWSAIKDKVSYLPTVKDCYRDLVGGKADACFAYLGCPVPTEATKADYAKVKVVTVLNGSDGATTAYLVWLKASPQPKIADQFVAFLLQPAHQMELSTVGLTPIHNPTAAANAQ